MKRLILGAALCAAIPAGAVDLTGNWKAETGYPGQMHFLANKTVEIAPLNMPPLKGAYVFTQGWLEITPADGQKPTTIQVSCPDKATCDFRYDNGQSQRFKRL